MSNAIEQGKPKRRQQARAIATIRKILAAAGHEFREKGFDGASLADITRRSGVTKGGISYHFPNGKVDMAVAVLADTLNQQGIPHSTLNLQRIFDTGAVLATRITEEVPLEAALRLSIEFNARNKPHGTPWKRWISINTEQFEAARQRGELLPGVDPAAQAFQIAGPWAGLVLISHAVDGHLGNLEQRVVDHYVNLFRSIAHPLFLTEIDMSVDRGRRLWEDFLSSDPLSPELE
ncbi:TetR/AcrR family transcriptional regulator [Streptomyces misionensis]|uniref:TetR/AcrR family transcriptional regulator n=1 Tax=Streptomyces misionensis TaxID=67331 RepID=UPI0033CC2BE6